MSRKKQFSRDEAKQIGQALGLDWNKIDVEQFRKGLEVELEHGARTPDDKAGYSSSKFMSV